MGRALEIRDDLGASELRALAAREKKNRAARRMLAIANALEGMSRAAAARAAGMDRQALRDAVVRYNAEGLDGLYDRPTPGRPPALTEAELALLSARIFRGPDPETDGVSSWTLPDLCRWIEERFDKRLPPQSLSRILRREGFSRQKTRPTHPKTDEAAQRRFEKGGSSRRWQPPPRPTRASG